ncbi:DUF1127 domain-containing protein [Tateyamaria pelophila]|uniref:DUF1127 domain-containing protein n=1 Tax=Tateyamaria pelophila TaxID=328415 RepID=UPI001CBCF7B5|nr:DUF1127 domain-containing protein [Tateyamaria pelophila]
MAYYNDIAGRNDLVERMLGAGARFLNNVAERHAMRRIYNTTKAELRALSGRELADLGIHPSEISSIAWEAAYGVDAS